MIDTAAPTLADWVARATALRAPTRPFIDGAFVDPLDGAVVADTTPRDGSTIASLHAMDGYTQLKTTWMDLS
jgi:hypothetical protein